MMLTTDIDMLLTNSDEPLVQAFNNTMPSNLVLPSLSRLVFLRAKYIIGIIEPMNWLLIVASAAPAMPHLNTAINNASNKIIRK